LPKSCQPRCRDHHRLKLQRKSTVVLVQQSIDLEERRDAFEALTALAVEREQLDSVTRWMAEMAEKTLRVDGDDDDR
jgi:hypothetical protein